MIAFCSGLVFSSDQGLVISPVNFEYEPYEEGEFPSWAMELRRADTIFFGSLAITVPVSALCFELANQLGAPGLGNTSVRLWSEIGTAVGLSLVITGIDWILGMMEKKSN